MISAKANGNANRMDSEIESAVLGSGQVIRLLGYQYPLLLLICIPS
jgi:hypothetical protein